jgi:hypothetical protein
MGRMRFMAAIIRQHGRPAKAVGEKQPVTSGPIGFSL